MEMVDSCSYLLRRVVAEGQVTTNLQRVAVVCTLTSNKNQGDPWESLALEALRSKHHPPMVKGGDCCP